MYSFWKKKALRQSESLKKALHIAIMRHLCKKKALLNLTQEEGRCILLSCISLTMGQVSQMLKKCKMESIGLFKLACCTGKSGSSPEEQPLKYPGHGFDPGLQGCQGYC